MTKREHLALAKVADTGGYVGACICGWEGHTYNQFAGGIVEARTSAYLDAQRHVIAKENTQ